jgi:hypothetical protein
MFFTIGPGNFFHHHATFGAIGSASAIDKENQKSPERNMFKVSDWKRIVTGAGLFTTRANGFASFSWNYFTLDGWLSLPDFAKFGFFKNE